MEKGIINRFKIYKKLYKNYLIVVLFIVSRSKLRHDIKVILKNGIEKEWDADTIVLYNYLSNNHDISEIEISDSMVVFSYKGKNVKFSKTELGDIAEVFGLETYKPLISGIDDYIIIDVGANIGDSAIFFAICGAKKVIALEPFPYSHNIALENVRINKLENKITIINGGYGNGTVTINANYKNNVGTSLFESENGEKIKLYSLSDLIKKYQIQKFILKMDCEGCEYNLKNENESIYNDILRIQMEYHYGLKFFPGLLSRLNYDIHFTKPKNARNHDAVDTNMSVGWLYAFKKD